VILLRALSKLVAFVLLFVLAVAGLATAISCISGGSGTLSLPWLAKTAQLPALRDTMGTFLGGLEAPGSSALIAAACGLGAMLLGALLIAGVVVPRRERLVRLRDEEASGSVAARRRPLGQAAAALVRRAGGVADAKVRVRPGRRRGGTVRVRADLPRTAEAAEVKQRIEDRLAPLTGPFDLRARVQTRRGDGGSRVQ
jgi:hypothetical protein